MAEPSHRQSGIKCFFEAKLKGLCQNWVWDRGNKTYKGRLGLCPDMCRFIAEEAYSFWIKKLAPAALRVLDLQDLHSLRRGQDPPGAPPISVEASMHHCLHLVIISF